MEENKVAQITKHTDSSRSTDSGVGGNAQTGAGEIRKPTIAELEAMLADTRPHRIVINPDGSIRAELNECTACSRLASRVEELEAALEHLVVLIGTKSTFTKTDRQVVELAVRAHGGIRNIFEEEV